MQMCHDNIVHVHRKEKHIMCFELYRHLVKTTANPPTHTHNHTHSHTHTLLSLSLSCSISLSFARPPVVVMGRDLSAHLMQLMFACAQGHKHRDTHSPDTHSAPLSLSVTTLSHSLSSASIPPPSLPASLSFSPSFFSSLHCAAPRLLIFFSLAFSHSVKLFGQHLL